MTNNSHFMEMQPRTTGQVAPPSGQPPMPMQLPPGAVPPPPQPLVTWQYQTQRPDLVFPPNLYFQPSRPVMSAQAQSQLPNSYRQPYTTNIPEFTGEGQSWFSSENQNVQVVRPPPQQRMERGVFGQTWFSTEYLDINPVTSLELTTATTNETLQSVLPSLPSRQSGEQNSGGNNSEKPLQPNPTEKPSSDWREHTSHDGRKFYYNKRMRVSSWEKPLELMTPNERADASVGWQEVTLPDGRKYYYNKVGKFSKWIIPDEVELARERANTSSSEGGPTAKDVNTFNANPVQQMARSPVSIAETSESLRMQGEDVNVTSVATDLHSTLDSTSPAHVVTTDAIATPARTPDTSVPMEVAPPSANAIHNTQFVEHQKRSEAEENRAKQKIAHEDFKKMLEESNDLTSTTRWSKVVSAFENDERFQAVEGVKDREDFLADYMEELKKKERTKYLKAHKLNEYWEFLKSCDFIKASSLWREVRNRLEADKRCSRLEKIERLELFHEYVHDLEKEQEKQIKLRMEEQMKTERKNRNEFRKLMAEHVARGIITSKTVWSDYCIKVENAPAYLGVYSNTSGSTSKDLFDDVVEDLGKQYAEDKEQIEDAVKSEKISISTSWTIQDFKTALAKLISSKPINDINLKLVFDELLEKVKEKEEKEAKKRKRLTDDVYDFLYYSRGVSASSKWEDFEPHVEEEFIGEESFFRDIFYNVIAELKEKERKQKDAKAKTEKERNDREKKRKNRRRRDRGRRELRDAEKHKKDGKDRGGMGSRNVVDNRKSRDKKPKKDGRDCEGTGSRSVDKKNIKSRDDEMMREKDGSRGLDENRRSRNKGKRKRDGTDRGTDEKRRSRDEGKSKRDGDKERKHRKKRRISFDKKSKKVKRQLVTSDADTGSRKKRQRR